jgi:hypothetical protein
VVKGVKPGYWRRGLTARPNSVHSPVAGMNTHRRRERREDQPSPSREGHRAMSHDARGASDSRLDGDGFEELRTRADRLAIEVARLELREQENTERIRRLKVALRALLEDLNCRVKTQEPLPAMLRDFGSVLREAREALED